MAWRMAFKLERFRDSSVSHQLIIGAKNGLMKIAESRVVCCLALMPAEVTNACRDQRLRKGVVRYSENDARTKYAGTET